MDSKDKEIERLRKENADLKKSTEEKDIIIEVKSKKIETLESQLDEALRRLRVYENPNTPPSQQRIKEKKEKKKSSNGKRGAPKGHKGTTREYKDPDETIPIDSDKCVKCGSENIHELDEPGTDDKIIEDLPPIEDMKPKVIKFERKVYECGDCKTVFTAEDKRCPKKGRFGVLKILIKFRNILV